jgi:hypothetical protein
MERIIVPRTYLLKEVLLQRRTEIYVGVLSTIIVITLSLVLFFVETRITLIPNGEWIDWVKGTLERLTTSMIVTATVTWLNVFFAYANIRKDSTPFITDVNINKREDEIVKYIESDIDDLIVVDKT